MVALTDDPQHDPVPYEDRVGVFLRMLQPANSVSAQLQDARDALTRAEEKENKAWSVLQNAKASYARASFVNTISRKSIQQIRQTFYGQDGYYQHGENFDQIEVDEDDDCWNRRGQDPEPPWQASSRYLAQAPVIGFPVLRGQPVVAPVSQFLPSTVAPTIPGPSSSELQL